MKKYVRKVVNLDDDVDEEINGIGKEVSKKWKKGKTRERSSSITES